MNNTILFDYYTNCLMCGGCQLEESHFDNPNGIAASGSPTKFDPFSRITVTTLHSLPLEFFPLPTCLSTH